MSRTYLSVSIFCASLYAYKEQRAHMASAVPKSGEVYYAEDGTVSIVLDDNYDPTYDPPDKEVAEYAKWLGIDPDNERELLWIARDGLKAPLPSEWKPCKTDTGDVYYFNFKTGESIWDHPMDDIYKKKVEDERAKLAKSGKGAAKLVKGGAGQTAQAKPMSRSAIEETRPKTGRLGAIGSTEEQKTVRPDISALLPTKTEQIASTLGLGKALKREPLKDLREMERAFRSKYDAEFDSVRATLSQRHEAQYNEVKNNLEGEKRKQVNVLKQDIDDEVDQARRNGERRNKRELGLYEDSIEKQREDLRRTLRAAQEKLEADSAGVNRRLETEMAEKRAAAEKALAEDIGRRRQEIQEGWQREKTTTEMQTQQTIRELGSAHAIRMEQFRQKESQGLAARLQTLENELLAELAAVKSQLEGQRVAHTHALKQSSDSAAAGATAQYNEANDAYQRAVAEARREVEQRLSASRNEEAACTQRMLSSLEQRKADAVAEASAQSQKGSQEKIAARRTYAATRVQEAQSDLTSKLEADKRAYEVFFFSSATAQQAATASAQQAKEQALAQRKQALDDADAAHKRRMDAIRSEHDSRSGQQSNPRATQEFKSMLAEKQAEWVRDHPPAFYHLPQLPPVPTFDPSSVKVEPIVIKKEVEAAPTKEQISAVAAVEASNAKRAAERENATKLDSLRSTIQASYRTEVEAHRRKATEEMNARLATYESSGGSPLRAARARVSQQQLHQPTSAAAQPAIAAEAPSNTISFAEADARTSALRDSLQRQLDALKSDLMIQVDAAAEDARNAQAEMEAATLAAAAAAASSQHPRPMSSFGVNSRAHTADAAYFQSEEPVPYQQASSRVPGGRSVTPGPTGGSHHTTPSKKHRTSTFEDRLAKAHDLLSRKKKDLKVRQRHLEQVRLDWKQDMSTAKAARDQVQIRTLKRVAEVLETDARQLNREALALKESYEWLRTEGSTYYEEKQHHQRGVAPLGGDLGTLLADILRKSDEVEHQVHRAEARRPSPGPDAMYAKWNTWLQRQPPPPGDAAVPHSSSAPMNAQPQFAGEGRFEGSPKKRDVEKWLKDQQRPPR
ncbi:Hypothetical protein, putative [Bodo saltans]|uniref:WW domain-containing protein n=1 Tax=Bodo saltans TaxID=75058 RepID=A0A0S4JB63_BODSA|nr:Hypothetical protein, putative [Bodo saltans]|eukprot:CUG87178.1 Hypothetical protein, putative [Bodo saltans]